MGNEKKKRKKDGELNRKIMLLKQRDRKKDHLESKNQRREKREGRK